MLQYIYKNNNFENLVDSFFEGEGLMKRSLFTIVLVVTLVMTSTSAFAFDISGFDVTSSDYNYGIDKDLGIIEETFIVDENGGTYNIGFVKMYFPKNFLDDELLPAEFTVKVIVKNGEAGVQVNPSTPHFNKKVHMFVKRYVGLLYDVDKEEYVFCKIKPQHIIAEHFSWFRFR